VKKILRKHPKAYRDRLLELSTEGKCSLRCCDCMFSESKSYYATSRTFCNLLEQDVTDSINKQTAINKVRELL